MVGELRGFQPTLGRPPFPIDQFQFAQLKQEGQMVQILLGGSGGNLLALAEQGRQLQ